VFCCFEHEDYSVNKLFFFWKTKQFQERLEERGKKGSIADYPNNAAYENSHYKNAHFFFIKGAFRESWQICI
jgi:hypothetical protein